MFEGKVFIWKGGAIYAFAARAVEVCEVSALTHEFWDDTMKH